MASPAQEGRSSKRETKKTWRVRENDVFTPICLVEPPVIAKGLFAHLHPCFEPESRVSFDSIYILVSIISTLQLFLLLLGEASLKSIVDTINANTTIEMH